MVVALALLDVAHAASSWATGPDAETARRQAHDILSERRFHRSTPPRPLRGVLRWIGDRLRWLTDPVERWIASVQSNSAFRWLALLFLVVTVAAIVVFLVRRRERARLRSPDVAARAVEAALERDPAALERRASEAEQAGRFDEALRLRFQSGLIRLAQAGRVPAGAVEPNGEIARELASPTFDALALAFDEVVYGGRRAGVDDAVASRTGWASVLEGSRR